MNNESDFKNPYMKKVKYIFVVLLAGIGLLTAPSCNKDTYFIPPPPHTPQPTSTLEVMKVSTPPSTLNSAYWKTADYHNVNVSDVSTSHLYTDGLLNMTGTYSGKTSFNAGVNPGLKLKAAYDNDNVYILAEWTDSDVNLSEKSWLWNGPTDLLKADLANGWTSQRNSDRMSLAFEIQSASNSLGTFSSVGCSASCHGTGNSAEMRPDAGKVDLWNWSLAKSAPLGYAEDMVADATGLSDDTGQQICVRNSVSVSDRSGPAYEWDGTSQTVTLSTGTASILDPAYYLFNKTPFLGDVVRGDSIYHSEVLNQPGHCISCHGELGVGGTASSLNVLSFNKKSRASLISSMDNESDMGPYWNALNQQSRDDLIAYIRGLCGVPGYYLSTPDGSNADLTAISNVTPINIGNAMVPSTNIHTVYKVLIIRKLETTHADDVQFDLSSNKIYKFGIALMDNDGKNHIGSVVETLTFK